MDEKHPSERRADDAVGTSGAPAAGGGGQTAQQAEITGMGTGGREDAARKAQWSRSGEPGRDPPNPGGASGGHANRKAPRGPEADETVVTGQSKAEREQADREGR